MITKTLLSCALCHLKGFGRRVSANFGELAARFPLNRFSGDKASDCRFRFWRPIGVEGLKLIYRFGLWRNGLELWSILDRIFLTLGLEALVGTEALANLGCIQGLRLPVKARFTLRLSGETIYC